MDLIGDKNMPKHRIGQRSDPEVPLRKIVIEKLIKKEFTQHPF